MLNCVYFRLARGRDEWESAALQNSNTKCNGLLPIWGPQVMLWKFLSKLLKDYHFLSSNQLLWSQKSMFWVILYFLDPKY